MDAHSRGLSALSAHRDGWMGHSGLRLVAAIAILAIAIAGCSIAFTDEESDAVDNKWKVSSKTGGISNGSISPADTESTTLEHTVTIKASNGYFVPAKVTAGGEVQLDGDPTGVTSAQVVAGSYTPNADRTSATVKVRVATITAEHGVVNIKCTCVKGTTIEFSVTPAGVTTIEKLTVAPGANYTVTLNTTNKGIVTGYDIGPKANLTSGTTTKSADITVSGNTATFTIPSSLMVSNKTVTAGLTYTLHKYDITSQMTYLDVKVDGTKEYKTKVTITITGKEGYHAPLTGITATGASDAKYTTTGTGNEVVGTVTIDSITSNIVLKGTGEPNTYKVTYVADALDVGEVVVKFGDQFNTYTYNATLTLPASPEDQLDHPELIFKKCVDKGGNQITTVPPAEHLEDFVVKIVVEDNMDYADYTPRNITAVLCIVAAVVLALVMVVIKR